MAKKEEYNIFDHARKTLGNKDKVKQTPHPLTPDKTREKTKPPSPPPPPPPPPSPPPNPILPRPELPIMRNMGVQEMLDRIRFMEDDLQKKMDKICELSGMSQKEIESFIENPNNFRPGYWKRAQLQKEQLEEKLYNALGLKAKKNIIKKKKVKLAKERKGKTLGARKGWMPM